VKGSFTVDPSRYEDYGPAKVAVSQLFAEWANIDWFAPPSVADAERIARNAFEEHHATARAREPYFFSPRVNVRIGDGGWDELRSLATHVRLGSA
jgi:hypothetical protein